MSKYAALVAFCLCLGVVSGPLFGFAGGALSELRCPTNNPTGE